jgi:hypothetical protein
MESIYTVENTIGRALVRAWNKATIQNTWESWNECYQIVRGMWLLGLYSDEFELEEYANMLMLVSNQFRLAAHTRELLAAA